MLAACGGDGVPGNAVVRVGDQSIKKDTFDHWMRIAAISQAGQAAPTGNTAPKANIPDAPDFEQCVARSARRPPSRPRASPSRPPRSSRPSATRSTTSSRTRCSEFLIRSTWLDKEAGEQEIKVTDKDVQKKLNEAKKSARRREGLPAVPDARRPDERRRLLPAAQRASRAEDHPEGDEGQGQGHRRSRSSSTTRRTSRASPSRAPRRADRADQDEGPRRGGQGSAGERSVVERASPRGTRPTRSPRTAAASSPGVARAQQEKALDTAIFKAEQRPGRSGRSRRSSATTSSRSGRSRREPGVAGESSASIKQILAQENQRKALEDFGKDYRERWKDADEVPRRLRDAGLRATRRSRTQPNDAARRRRRSTHATQPTN